MSRGSWIPWLLGTIVLVTSIAAVGRSGAGPVPESAFESRSANLDVFRARLDEVLAQPSLAKSRAGVEVLECGSGEIVYARNALEPLNPASNLKVLTSAAALEVLGPAFTFRTTLLRDGPIVNGIIKGNVYVRGEGDPELVYETVWKIVKDLQAQGITGIQGDLIADDSHFDEVRTIADWDEDSPDDETHAYNAPLGALSFNFNTIALIVRPGPKVGAPVQITLETPTRYVTLENRAITGKRKARPTLRFSRVSHGERHELVLEGRLPINSGFKRFYRTVPDPPRFALTLLSEMMSSEGIRVKGQLRRGKTPDNAVAIYYHYSRPLDILLKYMNKLSSNFIAEQLVKAMGARVYGAPGTTEKGLRVMREYLQRAGLPWEQALFMNGSGLSYQTRVSAHQIVTLLCHIQRNFRYRYDYLATFPIAGVDGTLRNRMLGTPAAGSLRAKTGSIKGVFGFSGYLEARDGRLLAFSFLVNDISGSFKPIKQAQDRWANLLLAGPEALTTVESAPIPEELEDEGQEPEGDEGADEAVGGVLE